MVSQLIKVPVVLRRGCADRQTLESLGPVTETDDGWLIEYTAEVDYFLDDETFMYDFCYAAASYGVGFKDVIRYDWDRAQKVRRKLP